MRKSALFFFFALYASASAFAQAPSSNKTPEEIKAGMRRLDESQKYYVYIPPGNYWRVCTPGGNVVERWKDGTFWDFTTLQLFHPDGRPRLCDPKTGYPSN